jgi:radical SAM superfamily enzyme YgiQ (UPF0313 family)
LKVLLVDNLVMAEDGNLDVHPHLGLLALAASAEADGNIVQIFDPKRAVLWGGLKYDDTLYETAAAEILSRRPEVVGFTTLGCSFLFAVRVAAILKRSEPDLPIIIGGPHATMLHREILEAFPQFDVVVRHEADETFPAVLKNVAQRRFDAIPGVSWRASSRSPVLRFTDGKPKIDDLDTLPIYSYEHYPVAALDLDVLRIEAGRGCPFACTFCSTAGFFQRSFRLKSAARLVTELDLLHERFGFSDFKLDHDMFTVNRKKVIEFCDAVRGRGYRWRASARVDCVDAELLAIMAESGCVNLYFGIETGSARMQRICNKKLDLDLVFPILAAASDVGIETTASFITGYPEETDQDQADTLDMLGRCFRPSCLTQLHMLSPEPGTPMFDRLGSQIRYDGYSGRYNHKPQDEEDRGLVSERREIFQTYYYYPSELPRAKHIFAVETVDLLRRAGPIVVSYLLRAYEGRLSAFVCELRAFADPLGAAELPGADLLEDYLSAKFGPAHHILSLFRYALRANDPVDVHVAPSQTMVPFDPRTIYEINPKIHILTDMHDCGQILAQIQREPERGSFVDDSKCGEVGTYLLRAAGTASTYSRLDPGAEAILSFFAQPQTAEDAAATIRLLTGLPKIELSFFESLVQEQILVPAAVSSHDDAPSVRGKALAHA